MTEPQDPFAAPGEQPPGSPPPPPPPPPPPYGGPPPQGYGAAPYGQAPYGGGQPGWPPASAKTNTLAIIALVGSFFCSPVGIICGIIALGQIKTTGEGGRGLAIAGIVIGGLSILAAVFVVFLGFAVSGTSFETTVVPIPSYEPAS